MSGKYSGISRLRDDRELILFSDESIAKGTYYSNFYGGVLVGSSQLERINDRLNRETESAGITGEMKWQKVTASRVEPYTQVVQTFFDEIIADTLKMRVMFTQNAFEPTALTQEHRDNAYFILYYQFLKHAFRFAEIRPSVPMRIRLHLDQLPDTNAKTEKFKDHLVRAFSMSNLGGPNLMLRPEDIAEVDSRHHIILQVMDVVLGAMAFRLDEKHKEKPEGSQTRGKRTVAKEKLYKIIRKRIATDIRPNFNIGMSTAPTDHFRTRWSLPYAHWLFRPSIHRFNPNQTKRNPTQPT